MDATHHTAAEYEDVQSLLAKEFNLSTRGDGIALIRVTSRGKNNSLFRATVSGVAYPLAVKICKNPESGARSGASARKQFDQLVRLCQLEEGRNFRVIEPVCVCDQKGILVTKWVSGPTLSNTIRQMRTSAEEFARDCERAGIWLSAFHSIEKAGSRPLDTTKILGDLTATLARTSHDSKRPELMIRAIAVLEKAAPIVEGTPVPQRLIHGDFHPGNFIKCGNQLIGLDTGGSRIDNNLRDLVTWMNHINHMTLMPRGLKFRVHVRHMNLALQRGYQANDAASCIIDEYALQWLRAVAATSFYERHRATGRTLVHRSYFRVAAGYNLYWHCRALRQWIG